MKLRTMWILGTVLTETSLPNSSIHSTGAACARASVHVRGFVNEHAGVCMARGAGRKSWSPKVSTSGALRVAHASAGTGGGQKRPRFQSAEAGASINVNLHEWKAAINPLLTHQCFQIRRRAGLRANAVGLGGRCTREWLKERGALREERGLCKESSELSPLQ